MTNLWEEFLNFVLHGHLKLLPIKEQAVLVEQKVDIVIGRYYYSLKSFYIVSILELASNPFCKN